MSFSSKVSDLREKEQKVLRSFLVFSFMGSLVLHILVLTLSSLWFRTPKFVEKPIGVIIVDAPSLKAAKPKPKDKIVPIGHDRRSDTHQSIKKIAAPGASSVSQKGQIIGKSSALSSQSTASQSAIAPHAPLVVSKKLSKPTASATTHKPIVKKPPQLVEKPKLVSRVTTPPPQSVETPKLAEAIPSSVPTPLPESVQTSTPTNIATLPPKLVEATKPVPKPITTLTPKLAQIQATKHELVPTPSLTATPKPTSTTHLSVPISSPQPQAIAENITHPPDTRDQGGNRKSVAIGSANRESRDESGGTGTRALGQSNGGSKGRSSGNGSQVATGDGNDRGSSIGSSGGVVCRRCPAPEYPHGTENLEGRAVVVINVEKDGNVSNVEIVKSTGYDKLDQTVLETVKKKWKFASLEKEQRVRAAVNFALAGSDFYHQARKREHQARELEHQGKQEPSLNP